jgi:hypothetical protein
MDAEQASASASALSAYRTCLAVYVSLHAFRQIISSFCLLLENTSHLEPLSDPTHLLCAFCNATTMAGSL